jgi:hypothetical protein
MEAGGLSGGQETVASASLLPFCPQNLSPRFGAPDSSTPIVFFSSDFQRSRPRPPRRVPPSQGGAPPSTRRANLQGLFRYQCLKQTPWPSVWRCSSVSTLKTEGVDLQVLQALFRTRTGDPLLTMERLRQPMATHGNGSRLFSPLPRRSDLPLIATGCNHGAPQGLHHSLSVLKTGRLAQRPSRRRDTIEGRARAGADQRRVRPMADICSSARLWDRG